MEVIPPVIPTNFDFNSSAYPRLMAENTTAPSSPARLNHEFDELLILHKNTRRRNSLASVPFSWEEKPGVPKSIGNLYDEDFAFDVSGELFPDSSVSAEDLFHDGLIKPVDIEPQATMQGKNKEKEIRGRDRHVSGLTSSRSRRTRSLPPVRGSEPPPSVQATNTTTTNTTTTTSTTSTLLSSSGSGKGSKKWRFKDLFLFRSASDGRALDRDPLKKYSAIFRKHDEDFRNSSLRDRSGSGSGSKRRAPRVSAHELHYTVNRAVSNDMKKKTFLPYKQGILGRLAFNPAVHALSNGFGFSHKS